ncbi:hypothetical protein ACQKP0_20435 [Heyndrickxia sp. NPDC080065]|uniref:hypothetical protein n=1 Tax=Heyndrickxia sp. NPDC080065 TaxID=3390568 RepID=UPI003CFD1E41
MKINKWKFFLIFMLMNSLLLAACGKDESSKTNNDTNVTKNNQENQQANPKGSTAKNDEAAPPIKEPENLPAKEKKAILSVLDKHYKSFNKKDLNGYIGTLSKNSTSFKIEDERDYIKKMFDTMNIKLVPENVVIIDYKDTEANVFTQMKTIVSEKGSKKKVEKLSRQVNTFKKENGKWKIFSTYAMETK